MLIEGKGVLKRSMAAGAEVVCLNRGRGSEALGANGNTSPAVECAVAQTAIGRKK
jgi:hypothetical protein